MNKWKAIGGVLLVFILGVGAGALGSMCIVRHRGEFMMRGGPHAFGEAAVRRLDHELKLTPDQHRQVEAIIADARTEIKKLHKEAQPKIDAIFEQAVGRVSAILRQDQKEKFDNMVQERREKMKRRQEE